jgi:predicted metal-dependent hydrolase
MIRKSEKVAAVIKAFEGRGKDPHYIGYFELFNQGLYYEAHDVLENLWLPDRQGVNGAFYKGLIQFAGAFVHLQKSRLRPAAALFKLAKANFERYGAVYQDLSLARVLSMITSYLNALESGNYEMNPLTVANAPKLALESSSSSHPFPGCDRKF